MDGIRTRNRVLVPVTSRAREAEIRCHRAQLAVDLRDNPLFVVDSTHWDTWFTDEHD